MKASDLERLIFTPFHTSKIVHHFLSGVQSVNQHHIKTELIYLVIPFVYNQDISNKLSNLNKASKLSPFIEKKEFSLFFSSLNEKINCYKKTTNIALILLGNDFELEIGKFLQIRDVIHYSSERDNDLKQIYKSAFNLGVLLSKEQYLTVFKKLNITSI